MLKLSFKLITNNRTVIDSESNYFIKDNVINFKIEEDTYSFNLENYIMTKKNKESNIIINPNEKLIQITLLSHNMTFDMEIIDSKVKKEQNTIEFTYTFESDEKTTNCIIINY